MGKILKNIISQERIPKQSKGICKRPKEKTLEKVLEKQEKKRLYVNARERERTRRMSDWLKLLGNKFEKNKAKELTKMEILALSKRYLEFLHFMDKNEAFFEEYSSMGDLNQAFNFYLIKNNLNTK